MTPDGNGSDGTANGARVVKLPRTITVRELGQVLKSTPVDVIKELMKRGVMVAINQSVEYDMAASVAQELGFEPQPEEAGASGGTAVAVAEEEAGDEDEKLQARPPVVTVMGHVDHGKTSLLDAIRETNVTAQEAGAITQHFGGDVPAIPVSAKTKQGLDDLLEHIQLVAEISELKANPERPAEGTIIEAEKDANRGPMATVIVEKGTLRVGDAVVAGESWGKLKAMFDHRGDRIGEATPAMPAEIMGLESVPRAGEPFIVVEDERTARELAEDRRRQSTDGGQQRVTLEALSGEIAAGRTKELNVVIKADVQGSVEAIRGSLERLSTPEVRLNIIHTGTGAVSESDVMLAAASRAIVVAFNVKADPGGKRLAENEGIDLRNYRIIYELIEDVDRAVKGLIEPVTLEVVDGHAQVRAIFRVRGGRIAGCSVTDGVVRRNSLLKVMRDGEVIHTSRTSSLRHFKDDVREVTAGLECGIGVERFESFQEGDVIEAFHVEQKG